MRESVSAACIKSYDKAEKGTLSPLECLSFANTIQADLPTCDIYMNKMPSDIWAQNKFKFSDLLAEKKKTKNNGKPIVEEKSLSLSQVGKSACIVLAKERHSKGERVPFSA